MGLNELFINFRDFKKEGSIAAGLRRSLVAIFPGTVLCPVAPSVLKLFL